mgnify:CR=1 FL=1
MAYTFTHDELFNPRYTLSTLVLLSVIKALLNEKETVSNREVFEKLPLSEKTFFRCLKILKEEGVLENKEGITLNKIKI